MKSTLSLLFSLIAMTTAPADPISFSPEPQTPFADDEVLLTISQNFGGTCYATTTSVERIGNTINVEMITTSISGGEPGDLCMLGSYPQSATINLGELQAGTYQVNVHWVGAPSWGSSFGTHSIEVTAAPILELLRSGPVGLRFESIGGFTYQVQWSTTLDSWFDLGGVITGTGAAITVHDPMEAGPTRYYQVKLSPPPDGPGTLPQLEVTVEGETLSCQLTGLPAYATGYWILQSSSDLNNWEDLLFFDEDRAAVVAIPPGGQAGQFLRARYLESDDPIWRDFLNARNTWHRAGIDRYSFSVFYHSGLSSRHGVVTVHNDEVISAIPFGPDPQAPPPPERSIDDWFAILASSLDPSRPRPDEIDVLYDPVYGFMSSASILPNRFIADHGQSWTISGFQPLP